MANEVMEYALMLNESWDTEQIGLVCGWRNRGRNLEADWACNIALDKQASFNYVAEIPDPCKHNIQIHSDGGLRDRDPLKPNQSRAVYGWAIRATNLTDRSTKLLVMGAEVLPPGQEATVPEL